MLKKAGITILFILICAGTSLVLMNVCSEAAVKVKGFYHVEDPGGESDLYLGPPREGRTISERRLDEPIVVDEYLPWFVDPFSGEIGNGKGFVDTVKKYGVFMILAVVFLFWYLRYMKKKRKEKEERLPDTDLNRHAVKSYAIQEEDRPYTLSEVKLNEIRQMLIDWESHLNFLNKKRSHETIQEWFRRIKGPIEIIPIYEKVRYGGKSYTHQELQLLEKFLK
jgi:hypothetical protein